MIDIKCWQHDKLNLFVIEIAYLIFCQPYINVLNVGSPRNSLIRCNTRISEHVYPFQTLSMKFIFVPNSMASVLVVLRNKLYT